MFSIGVQSNIAQVAKAFDKMAQGQVPFATSLAINRVAQLAKNTIQTNLSVIFDRPTPYTMNSLFVRNSMKTNLTAQVGHKEFAGKGTPASKYLRPEIEGGRRSQKRSEVILARLAGIPGGYWVPGPGARLNAYGNVTGAAITQILSAVGGLSEVGFQGNRTAASAKLKGAKLRQFFVMPVNNPRGVAAGVYERRAGKIIPVLFLIPSTTYVARYHLDAIVQRVIEAEFDKQFAAAMDYALSTARITIPA